MVIQNHLNLADRIMIKQFLDDRFSFKQIGRELGRDCTTISKPLMYAMAVKILKNVRLKSHSITPYLHRRNMKPYVLNQEAGLPSAKTRLHIWMKSSAR